MEAGAGHRSRDKDECPSLLGADDLRKKVPSTFLKAEKDAAELSNLAELGGKSKASAGTKGEPINCIILGGFEEPPNTE